MTVVLVIGANGYTGTPIVHSLLEHGMKVEVLAQQKSLRDPTKRLQFDAFKAKGAGIRVGSIQDLDSVKQALIGVDIVISCVVYGYLLEQIPLARLCKDAGVKRFVPSDFSTYCPPNVMALQDKKYMVHKAIKEMGLPYTFINSGSWYEVLLREIDGTPMDPVPSDFKPDLNFRTYGDGHCLNASTDLPEVGELVARIVVDPRTLNQSVFICGDALSITQMADIYESVTKRKLKKTKMDEARHLSRIQELRNQIGPLDKNPELPRELLLREYGLSRWIRGDNDPSKLPSSIMKASDLYPDFKFKKWETWMKERFNASKL
ncbi:hypothetical protein SmJEL517_g01398 [Synchytrium microbalum]|uniref:NmrA-like domain-containing protein n=1 Tax=Synchytrium microbalum TaxID=1806994 RepID=A0A507CF47_9FUNG|nr:uncharacterized protein SmJEL517_g01398 [Synchytrium microbalum]TPX36544.1 hypothetical protein SmJEL517_g01398 [Synchytrium microbalum]